MILHHVIAATWSMLYITGTDVVLIKFMRMNKAKTIKKSKRRDKKIAKDNAQSLVTKSVSRLGVGHNFLTRYAASLVSKEIEKY